MRYISSITRRAVLSATLNLPTDKYGTNTTLDWYPGSSKHVYLGDSSTREAYECVLEKINYRIRSIKRLSRQDFANSLNQDITLLSLDVKTVGRDQRYLNLKADDLITKSPRGFIRRVDVFPNLKYCVDITYSNELENAVVKMGIGDDLFDSENLDRAINPRKQYKIISFGYSIAHSLELQVDSLALKDPSGGVAISNFKRPMEVNVPYTVTIGRPPNN